MAGISEMSENSKTWNLGGVSVVGFSHEENDIPCQDAHAFRITHNNEVIAAVADGAGSAKLSHKGAQAFTTAIVDRLSSISDEKFLDLRDENLARSEIIKIINAIKVELLDTHASVDAASGEKGYQEPLTLRDFHSTLIIAICNADGGAFYHVGDGAGAAFSFIDPEAAEVSRPENGEYANETYFVTEENWEDHLRVTSFSGNADTILLMSDGVSGMAMTKGCEGPSINFVIPLLTFLKKNEPATNEIAVTNTLSKDTVRSITGDDKTLLWIIRNQNNKT